VIPQLFGAPSDRCDLVWTGGGIGHEVHRSGPNEPQRDR
jgi:hypothetical protein